MPVNPPKPPTTYHAVLRFRKSPFLECPRELRDIIYRYVLIEPDKFSRRHSAFCPHRTDGCGDIERPPFALYNAKGNLLCRCSKRQSLGLLVANRQIHDEAAPLFWSQNIHRFPSIDTFLKDMTVLRDELKQHLHRISILGVEELFHRQTSTSPSGYATAWDIILNSCKNLRHLELEFRTFPNSALYYPLLRKKLPHLQALTLSRFKPYLLAARSIYNPILPPEKEKLIYVKVSKDIPLDIDRTKIKSDITEPLNAFASEVDYGVHIHLLGRPRVPWSIYDNLNTYITPDLNDQTREQELKLPRGASTMATIYGLPQSPDTRLRLAKERIFEEARRRSLGLPTWQQEEAALQIQTRKAEEREQARLEAIQEVHRKKEKKLKERENLRNEQNAKQCKNKANQRVHLQRKMRKADKIKQEERKRVPKKI